MKWGSGWFALRKSRATDVAVGSKGENLNVSTCGPLFTPSRPNSGRDSGSGWGQEATFRTAEKQSPYSITSSACASSVGGISRPSVRAVCKLMTNSNLIARRTGRSPGFSPLRMRPV